ncbi:Imm26 family immunity protein [Neorhizobium sp. BETTINA12A]|uniref:Imm26 family immunity protein n=1 Tax=Neorhizobium sp. BETTINA12A TaxID=2908924 RepID=UPI001FF4A624|nr:Imm26 family immunity protein [Neorhizobium sp. BETTINA12A]MCJ9750669.1 Imm26 family immunity protein [Neorhizobium sp. BETTINA12A]
MQKIKRGDVYEITLGANAFAYAVALKKPLYGFFNKMFDHTVPIDEVAKADFAFRCCVADSAVKTGRWVKVGTCKPDHICDQITFFTYDRISGKLSSYRESENGTDKPLSPDEARLLEPAAVWSGEQVEDRLRDHFAGRPNQHLLSMMP